MFISYVIAAIKVNFILHRPHHYLASIRHPPHPHSALQHLIHHVPLGLLDCNRCLYMNYT